MALKFEDVAADDWFYRYVVAGIRFGLIEVASEENPYFEPDRYVTQGEFIAMLRRLHEYGHGVIGVPEEGGVYERYIDWALEIGIVHMYEYWDFMQDELMTREQMAVIIYKYSGALNLHGRLRGERITIWNRFFDNSEISDWARTPVRRHYYLYMFSNFAETPGYFMPHNVVCVTETLRVLTSVAGALYEW